MKNAIALAVVLLCSVAPSAAQKARDAVIADPSVHRVLLENEHIRVFEARASDGARTPMHSHPPFVFIGMDTARVKLGLAGGKSAIFDIHPGLVMWAGEGMEHSWELLSGTLNVIAVEIKSAQKPGAPPAVTRKANDSVAVDPDVHHVLFDNAHVRVFDGRASKGKKSPMHSHPPSLLVALGTGRAKVTTPDGTTFLHDYTPGTIFWAGEGMEHSWEMLSGDPHVIVVEPKSAHIRTTTAP